MRRSANIRLLCFTLLALALTGIVWSGEAYALPDEAGPLSKQGDKEFSRAAEAGRQVAGAGMGSVATDPAERTIIDAAPPKHDDVTIKVPPMLGFQQIANSGSTKEVLKRLVTSDVSVFYQTMMMVENGAATGFMKSMDTVGSLLSNTVQTTQLQMALFDANDPSGEKKDRFLKSAYTSATGQNEGFWPAALWWGMGDKVEKEPKKPKDVVDNPKPGGSNAGDYAPPSSSGGTGGTGGTGSPAPTKNDALLSERIFPNGSTSSGGGSGSGSSSTGEVRDMLKDAMLKWVGDYKLNATNTSIITNKTDEEWIDGTEINSGSSGGAGTSGEKPVSIYEVFRKKTKEDIWKHFNAAMKEYCQFKKTNSDNLGKEIFEKTRPSEKISEEHWSRIFSLDVRPSINLIDQIFKLFMGRRNVEEVDCNDFQGTADTMPETPNASAGSGTIFDSCSDKPKKCLRNIVLYRVVSFIAESQVNYYYRWLWDGLISQAQEVPDKEDLALLFCNQLRLSQYPCEPGHDFNLRLENNRLAWVEFSNKLSKFAQGQGGSTVFRPAEDHSPIGAVAAVGAGK